MYTGVNSHVLKKKKAFLLMNFEKQRVTCNKVSAYNVFE